MTDRAAMQDGVLASYLLLVTAEMLAEHEQTGRPPPAALCGDICAGLQDIAQHVMALEAQVRAFDVLGERDYLRAVRGLPTSDRRALAKAAVRQTRGGVVVRFPSGGAR